MNLSPAHQPASEGVSAGGQVHLSLAGEEGRVHPRAVGDPLTLFRPLTVVVRPSDGANRG